MRPRYLITALLCLLPTLTWSAAWTGTFKLDNFGYRPADSKYAFSNANPGATVQIRNTSDVVVYTVPADGGSITPKGADGPHSNDNVWWIQFDDFTTVGTYRLYSATLGGQSYDFEIRNDIYNAPVRDALRSFYYQRCGVAKPAAYAGAWSDSSACHTGDTATTVQSAHTNVGAVDLHGGWHDAGDYNKYVWDNTAQALAPLLIGYEDNQTKFPDNHTNIPESSNGIPDILDEVKYELDWIMRMQRPNGSFFDRVHTDPGGGWDSPPSADTNSRYYENPTLSSGAVGTAVLALGSRVFSVAGQAAYAATLKTAALNGWTWLQAQPGNSATKVWAAAEIFRLDQTVTSARTYVDGYAWNAFWYEIDSFDWWAAAAYIQTPGATPAIVTSLRSTFNNRVNSVFTGDDLYRAGMFDSQYYWGSNRPRTFYGMFLIKAAMLGNTGSHSVAECWEHARDFFHWMHGRNALNMLYLTNQDANGGEHSSWQFYHGWFGASGDAFSANNFMGKPLSVVEPAYPYFSGTDNHGVNDNKSSTLGPAPGFIPGGPNKNYSGNPSAIEAVPPQGANGYDRHYRDWADQSTWQVVSWEITENSISASGPYVGLGAYFVDFASPTTPTFTPTATPNWTATATVTPFSSTLFDNWEDLNSQHEYCAFTYSIDDGLGSTATVDFTAAGSTLPGGSPLGAVRMNGTVALEVPPTTWPNIPLSMELPVGFDATGVVGLKFSFKAGADSVGIRHTVTIPDSFSSNYEYYIFPFTPTDTLWREYTAYFPGQEVGPWNGTGTTWTGESYGNCAIFTFGNEFAKDCWKADSPNTDWPSVITNLTAVRFFANASQATTVDYDFTVDDVEFINLSGNYACTPTPTFTPLPSFTASPTDVGTPTFTHTPVDTPTFTPVDTLTFTPSDTPTNGPSATPSMSPSETPAFSPTFSPTDTPVVTPTFTYTPMPTDTYTLTFTPSPVFTVTFTPVITQTFTPVNTPVDTATLSPTPMDTPTFTRTATPGTGMTILGLSINTGLVSGGDTLRIAGSGFNATTEVFIGQTWYPPSAFTLLDSGTIEITTLAHPQGIVDVSVGTSGMPQSTLPQSFTFGPEGSNKVILAIAGPNPVTASIGGSVYAELDGRVDELELRIYTSGMTLVGQVKVPGGRYGWNELPIPPDFLAAAAPGVYYFKVVPYKDGSDGEGASGQLYLVR